MVRTWRTNHAVRRDQTFAMAVIAMLLASPITWDHYFVILALPLAVFWRHANSTSLRTGLLATTFLLVALSPRRFWMLTIPGYAQVGETAALATPCSGAKHPAKGADASRPRAALNRPELKAPMGPPPTEVSPIRLRPSRIRLQYFRQD